MTTPYKYFPYVMFCDGFDFRTEDDFDLWKHQKQSSTTRKDSPIRYRLITGNKYFELNKTYVLGENIGIQKYFPASIFARMQKWSIDDMTNVFVEVMESSIQHLKSLDKIK